MALAARLYDYDDARRVDRLDVELNTTLRDRSSRPLDVLVHNLSPSGFGIHTTAELTIMTSVTLGLPGVGVKDATIIWREGPIYGCEFAQPLTSADIQKALAAETVVPAHFGLEPEADLADDDGEARKLPGFARLLIIGAAAILSWVPVTLVALAII